MAYSFTKSMRFLISLSASQSKFASSKALRRFILAEPSAVVLHYDHINRCQRDDYEEMLMNTKS